MAVPATAEDMKQAAASVVQRMQSELEELQKNMDTISEQAVEEVERNWNKRKMEIVPGSSLLGEWYKKYQLRFDKTRDGPAIAAQMKVEEIAYELEQFIKGVARGNVAGRPAVGTISVAKGE